MKTSVLVCLLMLCAPLAQANHGGDDTDLLKFVSKMVYEQMPDSTIYIERVFNHSDYKRTSTVKKSGDLSCISVVHDKSAFSDSDRYMCIFPQVMNHPFSLAITGEAAVLLRKGIAKNYAMNPEVSEQKILLPGRANAVILRSSSWDINNQPESLIIIDPASSGGSIVINCSNYPPSLVFGELEFEKGLQETLVGKGASCSIWLDRGQH